MPSEVTQFRRGQTRKPGPGRPRGATTIVIKTAREICRALVFDPEYQESLRRRMINGEAGSMENLAWHYACGRPQTEVNVNFDLSGLTDEEVTILARIAPKIA